MTKGKERYYLFLITIIFIAACIETDIYLPAFPDMMQFFAVSEGAIQGLLTWNFVGICLSGPFYGPISDAFGRKKPLIFALLLFFLGSIMTLFANTLPEMLVGRVLQGFGSGGCFTLGTAILFDAFQKEKAVHALNSLNMAIPLIMSVAPMVGGFLNSSYGFRSNFLLIALFVLASLFLCLFFFPESLPKEKRLPFQLSQIRKDFTKVFIHKAFWQITMATSLLFAAYIAFLSYTSLLFVSELGVSKSASPYFQVAILAAWTIGGLVLKKCLSILGEAKIKKAGTLLCTLGIISFAITGCIASQSPIWIVGTYLPFIFGANWVFGLYFPEAMELLPEIKGVVASILTSVRLLIAAIIVACTSFLYNGTIYPLLAVIVGTYAIVLFCLLAYQKRVRALVL
ncbi:MAG: MFS transporter [Rhabdochlamydiaceae bacterium]|nr:MFS transporter [Rhabdochlamydiaceae bacterium]